MISSSLISKHSYYFHTVCLLIMSILDMRYAYKLDTLCVNYEAQTPQSPLLRFVVDLLYEPQQIEIMEFRLKSCTLCVAYGFAADGLEQLKDSVQLALAYYVSRVSSGVIAGSSRLARILLIPAGLRAIPASFVKMVFFGDINDHVMFLLP